MPGTEGGGVREEIWELLSLDRRALRGAGPVSRVEGERLFLVGEGRLPMVLGNTSTRALPCVWSR